MVYYFQIAGRGIRVSSDADLTFDWQSDLFRRDAPLQIHIPVDFQMKGVLPLHSDYTGLNIETRFCIDSDSWYQEIFRRQDPTTIYRTGFSLLHPGASVCALEENHAYVCNFFHIWPAIDLPWQLLKCGVLTLHSSVVKTEKGVILFTASSGTGKSTQAALWNRFRGTSTLNGDKCCLSVEDGAIMAHGLPLCGTSGICEDFSLPLLAIVSLTQAPANSVLRLPVFQAMQPIIHNAFINSRLPGALSDGLEIAGKIVERVPVYQFGCLPDESAVAALEKTLKEDGVL